MLRYLLIALVAIVTTTLSAATVVLDSNTTNPAVGGVVIVTFRVTDAPATTTWNQYLRFDKTKLKLTNQAAGTTGIFTPDSRSPADINASGEIRASGYAVGAPVSGSLTLGVFTFETLAASSTTINTEGRSSTNLSANMLLGPAPDRLITVPISTAFVPLNIGGSTPQRIVKIRTQVGGVEVAGLSFTVSPSTGTTKTIVGGYSSFRGLNPATIYTFTIGNSTPSITLESNN